MKKSNPLIALSLLLLSSMLSSCAAVEGAFNAGMSISIFIFVAIEVIAIVVMMMGKNRRS